MFPDSPYLLRIYPLWWFVALVLVVQSALTPSILGSALIYPKAIRAHLSEETEGQDPLDEPFYRDAPRIMLTMFVCACILLNFITLFEQWPLPGYGFFP